MEKENEYQIGKEASVKPEIALAQGLVWYEL